MKGKVKYVAGGNVKDDQPDQGCVKADYQDTFALCQKVVYLYEQFHLCQFFSQRCGLILQLQRCLPNCIMFEIHTLKRVRPFIERHRRVEKERETLFYFDR
jgi:hypothetical protein